MADQQPDPAPWEMPPAYALRLCDEFHHDLDMSTCSAQKHTERAVALGIVPDPRQHGPNRCIPAAEHGAGKCVPDDSGPCVEYQAAFATGYKPFCHTHGQPWPCNSALRAALTAQNGSAGS